jgi:hypothetical protein
LAKEVTNEFGNKIDVEIIPEYDGEGNLDIFVDNAVLFSSRETGRLQEEGEIVPVL